MKKHLFKLALLCLILPGCSKFIFDPEERLEGEWRLRQVRRTDIIGRRTITTGYEDGVFHFARNGFATFIQGSDTLKGGWKLRTSWTRFRDDSGNDCEGSRQELDVNLYNFTTNEVITLNFDDVEFRNNNNFMGMYDQGLHRYYYDFKRL